jgi:hypothetical protein
MIYIQSIIYAVAFLAAILLFAWVLFKAPAYLFGLAIFAGLIFYCYVGIKIGALPKLWGDK